MHGMVMLARRGGGGGGGGRATAVAASAAATMLRGLGGCCHGLHTSTAAVSSACSFPISSTRRAQAPATRTPPHFWAMNSEKMQADLELVYRVEKALADIFPKAKAQTGGAPASYIPELEHVNPELFGIALCGPGGYFWSVGDDHIPFTFQSCVKPVLYSVALGQIGDTVHDHIGHEPSGKRFNAFALDEENKPHNPMINSGAIMSAAIVRSQFSQPAHAFNALQKFTERAVGKLSPVNFNNSVYLSELGHAARNYALTYFMSENSELLQRVSVEEVLHLYFQACSMTTDVRGLAVLASTYAMGGFCPITQDHVMHPHDAQDTLSLMYNCGMYDYSGRFAFEVGIPAKSGVSGALFLSVPGKLGIAVYSPRVDRHGNSVRGLYVASQLVKALPELHVFSPSHLTTQVTEDVPSRAETEHLHLMLMQYVQHGDTDKVHELIECTGVDVNGTSPDGRTALHEAFASGRGDLAKFLLDHGADPTVTDNSGNTPLSEAERQGLQDFLRGNQAMGGNTEAGSLVTAHTHDSKETPTACDNEDSDTTDRS